VETDVAAAISRAMFERVVADIAVRFANVTLDGIDELIRSSLRQIGEALRLECVILWRKGPDASAAVATHHWAPDTNAPRPAPLEMAAVPFVTATLMAGEPVYFTGVEDLPHPSDRETLLRWRLQSGVFVPLALNGNAHGELSALMVGSPTKMAWPAAIAEGLRSVAGILSLAVTQQGSHAALRKAREEIGHLRGRLSDRGATPRNDGRTLRTLRPIESESPVVRRALAQVEQVAPTPATVLLYGETGAGKEVFAQAIHDLSPRGHRPMIVVNCAAIPAALLESEMFGREKGAYTDAVSRQIGRFEAANHSTLFLDEIGELPAEMQVKLLRVIEARVIERLGNTQPVKVDIRIIAATHRDLEAAVKAGTFREDLYYRLNVFPIRVPPLRERTEDIPGLVATFVDEFARAFGKPIDAVSEESLQALQQYAWPGNVRELRNVIERAVVMSAGRELVVTAPKLQVPNEPETLEALATHHICKVLHSTNWRIRGIGGAAERLGLKPTTLESRMAMLGIRRARAS
jgi:transcriptional regulator with GAF, ATPase, and Fis domain